MIDLGEPVPLTIGEKSIHALPRLIDGAGGGRSLVVADPAAWDPNGEQIRAALDSHIAYDVLPGPPGGFHRELAAVAELMTRAAKERRTYAVIVAFGGGVTQNVAGVFCALEASRPVLIRVPTTLAAMVDVAPSVRQALDVAGRKNRVRIRYAPSAIVCDVGYLDTAPRHTTADGFVEAVKAAMVAAPERLQRLTAELRDWLATGDCDFERVIEDGIAAKLIALEGDVAEVGFARCLRYGHEIGDILEQGVRELSHGEAVILGMQVSGEVARRLGIMSAAAKQWHDDTIAMLRPLMRCRIEPDRHMFDAIDDLGEAVSMVLLTAAGHPHSLSGPVVTAVPQRVVNEALRAVLEGS
ncbi:MAG: iron-containing alcohol dehydrogenase [Solirubrobacterales bacterium]